MHSRQATPQWCDFTPRSAAAILSVFLLVAPLSVSLAGDETDGITTAAREFRDQLSALADKCEELGLPEEARITRSWWVERSSDRQYLFLRPDEVKPLPAAASDLTRKWHARFLEIRANYAGKLWEQVQQEVVGGSGSAAYRTLYEIMRHDPQHDGVRRALRMGADEPRPRARVSNVAHPRLGWPRGRWWQVTTPHFQIATNVSQEAGSELARQLEDFHAVWRQLFFDYWGSREELAERLRGASFRPVSERKHQVVLFRDRDEYVRQLTPVEPKIHLTLGYYLKGNQTSYFYADDPMPLAVWYHEAAHQLFQETGRPIQDPGEKWNFWIVEGIAVYLESLTRHDGYVTVGGYDAERLQFVRSRVMGGDVPLPIDELSRLGRESLQAHPDIRRLYTQAAGLAHYLMDADGGAYRQAAVGALAEIYAGRDSLRTMSGLAGFGDAEFAARFKTFLTVTADDLERSPPGADQRNLSLAGAKITDESLRHVGECGELEWLDLAYTPVTDAGMDHLRGLANLKRLTLVNTRVTDNVAERLAPPALPCLEELDLSGTALSDAALPALGQLTTLRVLRLSHTGISDSGLMHLATLRNLEELDVDQTQVTPSALEQLKSRLPKLD